MTCIDKRNINEFKKKSTKKTIITFDFSGVTNIVPNVFTENETYSSQILIINCVVIVKRFKRLIEFALDIVWYR